MKKLLLMGSLALMMLPFVLWRVFVRIGQQFALRDRLRRADAIVVLAGTRGNIEFLHGKIRTAVHLFHQGWAPRIICSGKFSAKVTANPTLIPIKELEQAVVQGRLQQKDLCSATSSWDVGLGAHYMRAQALELGVPPEAVLVEDVSLHTRENADYVFRLLQQQGMKRIILVTSPFHQLRTYLTFAKVFQEQGNGIEIINYYAETGEWHPITWFLSKEHRQLVRSEQARIRLYRQKGDLL